MLPQNLGPVEARVLGALIEKELSTPDLYPLSLHALITACNQSSNREPVMKLDEGTVSAAIDTLRRQSLVRSFQASGTRVPKYQHLLAESEEMSRAEAAVLAVLILRGPQTLAEIRTRAGRLVPDESPDVVERALESLASRTPSAAGRLPRRPGQKEARYAHFLGGEVVQDADDIVVQAPFASPDRIGALEELTQDLQREVADLRAQLAEFRKQFE